MFVLTMCYILGVFLCSECQNCRVESAESAGGIVFNSYHNVPAMFIKTINFNANSHPTRIEKTSFEAFALYSENYKISEITQLAYSNDYCKAICLEINNHIICYGLLRFILIIQVQSHGVINENMAKTNFLDGAKLTSTLFGDLNSQIFYIIIISLITILTAVLKNITTYGRYTSDLLGQTKLHKSIDMIAVLDAISVGVITTDNRMNITFMNLAAGQMCGCLPNRAVGKTVRAILNGPARKSSQDLYEQNVSESTLTLLNSEGRYIKVQHSLSTLIVRSEVVGTVLLLQDVTASRELVRELSYTASHDPLTGLHNRESFDKRLQDTIIGSTSQNNHVLVFLDLDQFKAVNDSAGHAAGDALLKELAVLMKSQLRNSDYIARLGGDEFGLILYNCGLDQAIKLMEHLVRQINDYPFYWDGEVKYVGASVGITLIDASSNDIKELVKQADGACYTAKRRGKGRVCLYE